MARCYFAQPGVPGVQVEGGVPGVDLSPHAAREKEESNNARTVRYFITGSCDARWKFTNAG